MARSIKTEQGCPLEQTWFHQMCVNYPDHEKTDSFEHCSGRVACNKFKKMMDLQEQQIDILMGFLKPMMKKSSKPAKKTSPKK